MTSAPSGFNVQGFDGAEGARSLSQNLGDVFDLRADNTFLIKASYWINW